MFLLQGVVNSTGSFVVAEPSGWWLVRLTVPGTDSGVTVALNKRTGTSANERIIEEDASPVALTQAAPERLIYIADNEQVQAISSAGTATISVEMEKAQG